MCNLIRTPVQLTVGESQIIKDNCFSLRRARNLRLKQFVDTGMMRIWRDGVVPIHQQLSPFIF